MRRNIFWDLAGLQNKINDILNSEEYTDDDIYKILDKDYSKKDGTADGNSTDNEKEEEPEVDMDYEKITTTVINPKKSEYEDEISLPEYDSNNITMFLIKSNSD
jgi:hypothetical protein